MHKVYALMRGGRIYTLRPTPKDMVPGFQWMAYCDGQRWGFFKSKKEFEEAVAREPDFQPDSPHAVASFRAEAKSRWEGQRLLDQLHDQARKDKGAS